ncbi:Uncharacterised protein [Vibrio cholerae]|nr:Uncharacterised protein [Vibrio cholerae]
MAYRAGINVDKLAFRIVTNTARLQTDRRFTDFL